MKKIPTLFERIYEGHRIVGITPKVTPGMEWVLNGEGIATVKWDGACCAIINGELYKRYDAKKARHRLMVQYLVANRIQLQDIGRIGLSVIEITLLISGSGKPMKKKLEFLLCLLEKNPLMERMKQLENTLMVILMVLNLTA